MNLAPSHPHLPTCAAVQRSERRAFTLLELLTVVSIIAIFTALAMPSMVNRIRDRRTGAVAEQFANTYRVARMRALGRGSAVLVRYDRPGQMVTVLEAVAGAGTAFSCVLAPVSSCTMPAGRWSDTQLTRELDRFNPFSTTGVFEQTRLELWAPPTGTGTAALQTQLDICYTPSGTSYFRLSPQGTFAELNAVPYIRAWSENASGKFGVERRVFVLPNGVARVGTWSGL
jgi:type IV fimbrial biogenesis protein FimT